MTRKDDELFSAASQYSERDSAASQCNERNSSISQDNLMTRKDDELLSTASQCSERDSAIAQTNLIASDESESTELIVNHNHLENEIKKLYKLLEIKNCEINYTYNEVKKMNMSFHYLNQRLRKLEETVNGGRKNESCSTQSNECRNTTSLITNLTHRISDLENMISENTQAGDTSDGLVHQTAQHNPDSLAKKHLTLGDINLSNVQVSDLSESWSVRTLGEANYDLMGCWVREKLSWTPATCIIYAGLFDILASSDYTSALDNLGTLISELKLKNENMDINVS